MFSLRGDAHKLYLQLKKTPTFNSIKALSEVEEIVNTYKLIDSWTLRKTYYRMIKEKNGSGIIPIYITAIPWFLFLFSSQLQDFLFKEGSKLWLIFVFLYFFLLTFSVVIHFREKAWAALHIEIIQDILAERDD